MKQKLSVVKIGGNLIEDAEGFKHVLELFSKMNENKILVHGGGKKPQNWQINWVWNPKW